jgi:hypothetical protein
MAEDRRKTSGQDRTVQDKTDDVIWWERIGRWYQDRTWQLTLHDVIWWQRMIERKQYIAQVLIQIETTTWNTRKEGTYIHKMITFEVKNSGCPISDTAVFTISTPDCDATR